MTTIGFLELQDFRNHKKTRVELSGGLTLLLGPNGSGKTNLIEAIWLLARGAPLRSVPTAGLIREGAEVAIARGEFTSKGRKILIEAELPRPPKRLRLQANRQPIARKSDLRQMLCVTSFLPSHLSVVQAGPDGRREFLDEAALATSPKAPSVQEDLQQVLRQRNAFLRQLAQDQRQRNLTALDVWDEQLVELASECEQLRKSALLQATQVVTEAYLEVAGTTGTTVDLSYERSWQGDSFAQALRKARSDDIRRGLSTIGPHRDDLLLSLNGLPARTHISQGEQRTLALAMRIALHQLLDSTTDTPILLLDDVLSELDQKRSQRFIAAMPSAQVIVTSATPLPVAAQPDQTLHVLDGRVR